MAQAFHGDQVVELSVQLGVQEVEGKNNLIAMESLCYSANKGSDDVSTSLTGLEGHNSRSLAPLECPMRRETGWFRSMCEGTITDEFFCMQAFPFFGILLVIQAAA